MPQLHEHFVRRGATFTAAYAPGFWCTPSRTAMLTGRHVAHGDPLWRQGGRQVHRIGGNLTGDAGCDALCQLEASCRGGVRHHAPRSYMQLLHRLSPARATSRRDFAHIGRWHVPFWLARGVLPELENRTRRSLTTSKEAARARACSPGEFPQYGRHRAPHAAGIRKYKLAANCAMQRLRGCTAKNSCLPACGTLLDAAEAVGCGLLYYKLGPRGAARVCAALDLSNETQPHGQGSKHRKARTSEWRKAPPCAMQGCATDSYVELSGVVLGAAPSPGVEKDARMAEQAVGVMSEAVRSRRLFYLSVNFEGTHPPYSIEARHFGPKFAEEPDPRVAINAVYRAMLTRTDEHVYAEIAPRSRRDMRIPRLKTRTAPMRARAHD